MQDRQQNIFDGIVHCKVEIDKRLFLQKAALERLARQVIGNF